MSLLLSGTYLYGAIPSVSSSSFFTMACWFRPTESNAATLMSMKSIDGDLFRLSLLQDNQFVNVRLTARQNAGTDGTATSNVDLPMNTWQHVVGVASGNGLRILYVNGVPTTDSSSRVLAGMNALSFGSGPTGDFTPTTGSFSGFVAEAAIWNKALSRPEVEQLVAGYSPSLVNPQGLVFYSPLINNGWDISRGALLTGTVTASGPHARVYGK